MTTTIARGTLGATAILTAAFQSNADALTDMVLQLPGGSVVQALTIAAGVVTPLDGEALLLKIDVESGGTDDLDTISLTNVPNGSLIFVYSEDDARDIVIKDGAGNLNTVDSNDFTLDTTDMLWVGRVEGAAINETFRSYGDRVIPFRAFLGLGTAAVLDTGTGASDLPDNADIFGLQTIWMPVDSMKPQTTAPCSPVLQTEIVANQPELVSMDFDPTTPEHAIFTVRMPKNWDELTLTCQFYYTCAAAIATTFAWELAAVSRGDNEAIATSYGTAVQVIDTFHNVIHQQAISAVSSALTVGGSPAAGELVNFRASRAPGSDTSTSDDGRLQGVAIFYTINALNDN